MKRVLTLLMVVGLLWPSTALAWEKSCNGTDKTTLQLSPGEYACWNPLSDTVSGYMAVFDCENIDIAFNSDIDDTTSDTTVQVWECFDYAETASTSNCNIAQNLTLDGVTATGTANIFGHSAVWIVADVAVFSAGDEPRLIIKCNGPQGIF